MTEFPRPGETVLALDGAVGLGGKGANQAVAAALTGARVLMIGAVGTDAAGSAALTTIDENGVDASRVARPGPRTGAAYITVNSAGENTIVVDAGANALVDAESVTAQLAGLLGTEDAVLLLQGELSSEVVAAAIRTAASGRGSGTDTGTTVVLNLAPVIQLADDVLTAVDVLVLNEGEARDLAGQTGAGQPADLAAALRDRYGCAVVITLGADGVLSADDTGLQLQPARPPARVADTTGAGDAFTGTLAAALAAGLPLASAVAAGSVAGSIAVESAGTITSYPRGRDAAALAAEAAPASPVTTL